MGGMANVLIRDLDDELLARLKTMAQIHGRSLQAEIHDILRRAGTRDLAHTRRLSDKWMKRFRGRVFSDSAELIREDRDRR